MIAPKIPLQLKVRLSDHLPENTIFLGRADPERAMWLSHGPGTIDWMASGPRLMFGGMRRFVHRAATGPASMRLYEWAGLTDDTRHIYFRAGDDCYAMAEEQCRKGAVILCQHLSPRVEDYAINWLTPPPLLAALNNKAKLADWTPEELTPKRFVVEREDFSKTVAGMAPPFVVKAGTDISATGGNAIRICRTEKDAADAVSFFLNAADSSARFVIEDYQRFAATWCANVGVYDDACDYWGAAQQILDETGKHIGNLNGAGFEAPDAVRDAALEIAEKARAAGYRGIAGMDIGLTEDGRLLVFDFNFRTNACTSQLLYHDSACARIGAKVSQLGVFAFESPLETAAAHIEDAVKAGRFVPLASFDKTLHETAGAGCLISGIALGKTAEECADLAGKIDALE